MRIVIAPDSFKESASARQIAGAMEKGVRRFLADAEIVSIPMADGGEGTSEAFLQANDAHWVECSVSGPLCEDITAKYVISDDNRIAVIEMAAASGLALLRPSDRDPMVTTTRGVGEMMVDALEKGVEKMIIGVGGSATNDGGAGMAQALGVSLLDAKGRELAPGGQHLLKLAKIDMSGRHPRLDQCEVVAACDVSNPLSGPSGAARVYALQKGATESEIITLDNALRHFGQQLEAQLDCRVIGLPGAGAAGGLGAGLIAFAGAKLEPGIRIMADICGLEDKIKDADLVLTGEGRFDSQSINGKTPVGVAKIAKKYGVPVIVIAGSLESGFAACYDAGVTAAFPICQRPMSLSDAMREAEILVADTTEAIIRLWCQKS
ncbi:MAG: glycerate kinase [Candidatus Sumerlaeota bacterium]